MARIKQRVYNRKSDFAAESIYSNGANMINHDPLREQIIVRECRRNYAHGPMKLTTKRVVVDYLGQKITCEKSVYTCQFCDFELHEKWMEDKLNEEVARIYAEKHSS